MLVLKVSRIFGFLVPKVSYVFKFLLADSLKVKTEHPDSIAKENKTEEREFGRKKVAFFFW